MTLLQTQSHSAGAQPAHRAADEDAEQVCPQVGDDMTVEVALSVMASARAGHLLVRDEDGLCIGLVTPAQLAAARGSDAYTDRVRLRDLVDVLHVADGQGGVPGAHGHGLGLALAR
ncbi:CBS domain-containing protein [Streptomyces sp. NPDC001903]|uniref:CBS domain-containing protein n=1 Tax=Streptomyces sp. NPDC001903 TaxID=3364622 RepID=UPI0036B5BFCE